MGGGGGSHSPRRAAVLSSAAHHTVLGACTQQAATLRTPESLRLRQHGTTARGHGTGMQGDRMDSAHRLGQGSATRPHPETRPHLVWLPQFHTRCGLHLALGTPGGAALAPAGPPQAARTAGGLLFGRTQHRQAKITHLCRGSLGPSRDPSSPSHSPAPPTATSAPSADLGAPPLPWPYTVATTVGSGTPPPFQNNVSPGGQSHALGLVLCSATAVSAHTPHLGDSRGALPPLRAGVGLCSTNPPPSPWLTQAPASQGP